MYLLKPILATTRKLLLLFLLCTCTVSLAQGKASDRKALKAKTAMIKASGGEKALNAINLFSYSILKTSYGTDTITTRTDYILDLSRQYVEEKQFTDIDSTIRWTDATGAWIILNGNKSKLPEDEIKRLQRILLTNFISMLKNDALEYVYKESTSYKGKTVDIIKVYTPSRQNLVLDLFIDSENGQILTSSKPDPETGKYSYYADELDYQHIGEGVKFPLVYQVWIGGKIVTEGRFMDVVVRK
ncbi:hypothetical protein [Pontibacter cellulosilyticus]|uniref:Uncharacterized protein n=1 Tax=Pontibacter cellulosilyticus TaxID=1720253 RepID=A0A923N7K0_9BACT|nr:hypothetical protein [Pontibacter cellulosilyticus]MBC5993649.1 hypothetical protein [Pontibacter cellulosilyticus]